MLPLAMAGLLAAPLVAAPLAGARVHQAATSYSSFEYESDDPPEKVIAYYKDQLKKYGNVLECHTNKHGGDVNVEKTTHDSDGPKDVKCEGDNHGSTVELKVGTEDNQHVVAVEPRGKGCDFALVFVQTRGKDTI